MADGRGINPVLSGVVRHGHHFISGTVKCNFAALDYICSASLDGFVKGWKFWDNARIYGFAKIFNKAIVYGNAKVYGNAQIFGKAKVYGNAEVYENAEIFDYAFIFGDAKVFSNAKIFGTTWLYGAAKIGDKLSLNKGKYIFATLNEDETLSEIEPICYKISFAVRVIELKLPIEQGYIESLVSQFAEYNKLADSFCGTYLSPKEKEILAMLSQCKEDVKILKKVVLKMKVKKREKIKYEF